MKLVNYHRIELRSRANSAVENNNPEESTIVDDIIIEVVMYILELLFNGKKPKWWNIIGRRIWNILTKILDDWNG